MSTEIARTESSSLGEKMEYAKALASAGLLPKAYRQQPGNILLAIEFGESLGIPTVQAINTIHVVEGKPSASAALISALVRRAGHKLRVEGTDTEATATIIRNDDPSYPFVSTWTVARAKTAGLLSKDNWRNYPAAMLKARAITEVARDACQEALMGVQYTPEELGAEVDAEGDPIHTVTVLPKPAAAAPEQPAYPAEWTCQADILVLIADATTSDELRALWEMARRTPWWSDGLKSEISAKAESLRPPSPDESDEVVDAEIVEAEPDLPAQTSTGRSTGDDLWGSSTMVGTA